MVRMLLQMCCGHRLNPTSSFFFYLVLAFGLILGYISGIADAILALV